ncbi:GAF and ANTAR domain-containing protein [Jatrophihabitans sp.]|uniref:GAF and ANTAR domain-containing protein n=1 Tax=Jatrophihabitans sp. TaxID=1932789 RepID=UPI002D1D5C6F|nr:GAF and ANTAR domain-containing protein [Jatrophihabitans sp.]
MTADQSLQQLAEAFAGLEPHLRMSGSAEDVLASITSYGLQVVKAADHAAITRGRTGSFKTVAATSDIPLQVDAIQYELGYGPCVDAIVDNTTYRTGDLPNEPRWPGFGQRAAEETGVRSMLSFRMFLEGDDLIAGLNFYSGKPDAFDDNDQTLGLLLSTHGALALSALRRGDTAAQLARALESNREIGVAMGVLMAQHKITREQAFDLLRVASQHTHRKLADIAADVADTGTLDLPTLQ